MVEVVNMLPPPHMLPMKAPKPPAQLRCAITGKPARYRDPVSGYGYADSEAYKELKQRLQNEKRGIMTGKRTKRQAIRAPSVPGSGQQALSDTDAIHHTGSGAVPDSGAVQDTGAVQGSGAVQASGADTLPVTASAAPEAATAMPTANITATQASPSQAPASITNVAATSEVHALAPAVIDAAGHSKPLPPGTAGTQVSDIPDETAVQAASKDSNPASTAAISHITGASEAAARQASPHGSDAAADSKGAAASAAADSTAVQVPTAHGASPAPTNASSLVANAPKQATSIASPGKLTMLCLSTVLKLFTLTFYSETPASDWLLFCFAGVAGSSEQQNAIALQSGVTDMEQ